MGGTVAGDAARAVALSGLSQTEVLSKLVDIGEGRPVVFLHGLVGLNDHWEDVVRRLTHRLRCIMLEIPLLSLRGPDCSVDGVLELTERFLDRHLGRTGSDPAPVLVGNSFGGHIALRLALQRPDLVGALVLAGSSGLTEKTMVTRLTLRPSREWLQRKIAELFYDPAKNLNEADVDRAYRDLTDREGARAMVKLSRSARNDHLGDRVGGVRAPTLLIWGRNDVVTPPEAAEQFRSSIPGARLVWFEECGHAPMMERPEEFARTVLQFTDELDRRDAPR